MNALIERRRGDTCDGCRARLVRISLARNYLGTDGAMAIADFITAHSSFPCSVRLKANGGNSSKKLCDKCKITPRRREEDEIKLDLLQNSLKDEGVIAIADAIHKSASSSSWRQSNGGTAPSSCIVELGLEKNKFGDVGLISLSQMIRTNNNLHTLRLGKNSITCQGIIQGLAPALKVNTTLQILSLMGNANIGDEGAKSLGEALRCNQTLKTLLLAKCGVSDAGALHILKALYNDESAKAVLEESNHSLTEISLCSKSVSSSYSPGYEATSEHKPCNFRRRDRDKASIMLKELIIWNKYGFGTARRLKLEFFLCSHQGPRYINASNLDRKLLPMLFYRLWKINRDDLPKPLFVLYSYTRGMPELLEL
eukprot:CAMPEP_0171349328 /NCGR_PEP_ID=MMETSP0878-20121228/33424_1 /TAXON_ID=67004 /ORGANISM="Thalassiosira weissflogii, Strain CCMP1336" /LENGTH=367 /DNA_ID=CAMNT_0011853949 /DNA_START=288 /DNA_END=1391 /DNA_ORIENTATION=+